MIPERASRHEDSTEAPRHDGRPRDGPVRARKAPLCFRLWTAFKVLWIRSAALRAPVVRDDSYARCSGSRFWTLYHTRAHIITLEQNPATYPFSMRDLCNLPSGRTRQATGGLAGNSLSVERARRLSDPLISFIWPTNSPEGRYMLAPLRSYSFLPARS